jgi:hypothetical protein
MEKLTIELVPTTSWYDNVRNVVSKEKWDVIRFTSYRLANNKCEICDDTGKNQGYNHNVECHEIWEYNDKTNMQTLVEFISLCPYCHKTKHAGLAEVNGELDIVYNQLIKINDMSLVEAKDYVQQAFKLYVKRSIVTWGVDIKYIDKFLIDNNPIEAFNSKY